MDIRKLQRAIVDGLEDVKAQNIVVLNTEALSPLFERVIVASGTSNRQTKALAASVRDAVKSRGFPVLATEGEGNAEWIIVDCGAAVAHIMQPAVRDYYRLEEIWGGKAVHMKMAAAEGAASRADRADQVDRARRAGKAGGAAPPAPKLPAQAARAGGAGKQRHTSAGRPGAAARRAAALAPPGGSPAKKAAAAKRAAAPRKAAAAPAGAKPAAHKAAPPKKTARTAPARKAAARRA
jgi:ribosome-associated protein